MEKLLNQIDNKQRIKDMNMEELKLLAKEIREFMIETISNTGGHLASNLGVVELTIAMHYVFESPEDKFIFDVGHQSYVHKILTGRKDRLYTIRQHGGLSGFPKRAESEHDVFETGHSSTSISAALGFANARDLRGEKHHVIALIGDGALTGGMALEALNNVGRKKTNLIIILNDNEMSISKNVGSISTSLSKMRAGARYYSTKKSVERVLNTVPMIGKHLVRFIKRIKEASKSFFVNGGMLFEEFGIKYIGPVDGHNLEDLIDILKRIKFSKEPLVLHVHTKKGKGYKPAEDNPGVFHGVGKFDKESGEIKSKETETFSDVFGKKIVDIAKKENRVVAVTAAMKNGTGLDAFADQFPNRFFDVGIAEQHGMTLAAGMAAADMIPVYAIYATFLQRAYDQLVHDIALQNHHVVICVDRAGLVGSDGETHQGVFDSGFLYQIPNLTILTPSNSTDLENMLEYAVLEMTGPVVIRYPRGEAKRTTKEPAYSIEQIMAPQLLKEGKDMMLMTYGRLTKESIEAVSELRRNGVDAGLIKLQAIKPIYTRQMRNMIQKGSKVLFIDETVAKGTVGNLIASELSDHCRFRMLTLPDAFIEHGSVAELTGAYNLDSKGISQEAMDWISEDQDMNGYELS